MDQVQRQVLYVSTKFAERFNPDSLRVVYSDEGETITVYMLGRSGHTATWEMTVGSDDDGYFFINDETEEVFKFPFEGE